MLISVYAYAGLSAYAGTPTVAGVIAFAEKVFCGAGVPAVDGLLTITRVPAIADVYYVVGIPNVAVVNLAVPLFLLLLVFCCF